MRRRIYNLLLGAKSRFFAALRMTMLAVGFVLSQQSLQGTYEKRKLEDALSEIHSSWL